MIAVRPTFSESREERDVRQAYEAGHDEASNMSSEVQPRLFFPKEGATDVEDARGQGGDCAEQHPDEMALARNGWR